MRYQAALRPDGVVIGVITYLFNQQMKEEMIQNMNLCRSLWGQFGGSNNFFCPNKSKINLLRLIFWGQRWGFYVPRFFRVIYSFRKQTK